MGKGSTRLLLVLTRLSVVAAVGVKGWPSSVVFVRGRTRLLVSVSVSVRAAVVAAYCWLSKLAISFEEWAELDKLQYVEQKLLLSFALEKNESESSLSLLIIVVVLLSSLVDESESSLSLLIIVVVLLSSLADESESSLSLLIDVVVFVDNLVILLLSSKLHFVLVGTK